MTQAQAHFHTNTLDQVIDHIFSSHQITRADQYQFMTTLLSRENISYEDQIKINRVFDGLRRGLLRVVD